MPTTKRLRRHARSAGGRFLSLDQECELITGLAMGGESFESPEARERAWWAHRERLMEECAPLQRPFGFWQFEAKVCHPGPDRERDEDALLRLELKLTPRELAILTPAPPPWIPEIVPLPAVDHWEKVARSMETRRQWHQREGRPEQADAWRKQRELLLNRIATAERLGGTKAK